MSLTDEIKQRIGWKANPDVCADCRYFQASWSTDGFGPGDLCMRNPDLTFPTTETATCLRWMQRDEK